MLVLFSKTLPSHFTIFTKFCFTLNSYPLLHFFTHCLLSSFFFTLAMLPPCDVTFAVPHCLSSFIRPIVLVSPLPRFYFCQRFFFPSHPSDPLILPVQNFSFTLSCGCSRAVFLKFLFPAQHSNSLFFLSLSPALGVHQAAYVSSLPLLMTVLHQVPRHDSAIFWLALKATRELWLFPFAANSPYRQSNLTFLFSLQSTNFIKISIAHASTQSHLRLSVSSIS